MTEEEIDRAVTRFWSKFDEAEALGRAFFGTTNRIANALEAMAAREPEPDRSSLFAVVGAYLEALGPCDDAEPDDCYCQRKECVYCQLAYEHYRIITLDREAKR